MCCSFKIRFVPVIIRPVHHVSFTSLTISRLRTRSPCIALSMDTHVRLNIATRSCNVYPGKCWFAVLCRFWLQCSRNLKADSHIACRAHAVPLSCRAAKSLECGFPIWFTQCGRVWFTLAMPRHALTMPFFSRSRHSTAVERRPVGYLPAFAYFRLSLGVPRRLLSEAYQSPSQRSIPATVKSGSNTLQKRRSVKLLD